MTEGLRHLLEKIYQERDIDFREYKETILTRRLGRRLRARRVSTYASYSRLLDQDPIEYDYLLSDLTIKVSSFFRDNAAFSVLAETVLPTLVDRGINNTRIWSAGCATGEEPYSIAMLLLEILGRKTVPPYGVILGTDVDAKALNWARKGWFTLNNIEAIQPAWRNKYFTPEGDGFRVQPAVRQLVIFERHNLVSDLPYHGFDLVTCRNVLIYFNPRLQVRVLKNFHEQLKEGGFLLLGKTEVPVEETRVLFNCINSKAKLFHKTGLEQMKQASAPGLTHYVSPMNTPNKVTQIGNY